MTIKVISCPIHPHKSYGTKLGFEHLIPGSTGSCAIDCPVELGPHIEGSVKTLALE